jgi:hypothetical protein
VVAAVQAAVHLAANQPAVLQLLTQAAVHLLLTQAAVLQYAVDATEIRLA